MKIREVFDCGVPLCRWKHFNGDHPDLPHAVWWGCTKRPPRPFQRDDLVMWVAWPENEPFKVHSCTWDSTWGWQVCRYGSEDGRYSSAPHPAEMFRHATPRPVQADVFTLLDELAQESA